MNDDITPIHLTPLEKVMAATVAVAVASLVFDFGWGFLAACAALLVIVVSHVVFVIWNAVDPLPDQPRDLHIP